MIVYTRQMFNDIFQMIINIYYFKVLMFYSIRIPYNYYLNTIIILHSIT